MAPLYRVFITTICILPAFFFLAGCNNQSGGVRAQTANLDSADVVYIWSKLTDSADFPKSYNMQLLAIRDTLWLIHHDSLWFSVDGRDWIKSSLNNVVRNNAFLDYVWFKGALYGLGTFEGNIEHYTLTSAIHRTTDMRSWQLVADSSNLPRRFFYHPFVFDDQIWIIGGGMGDRKFSDIWSSTDGVSWVKRAEGLSFGEREGSQFVFFRGKIFMLDNDVWSSPDALHWTKVADRIVSENIFGYSPVVFDDQIWLLGCSRDNIFKSEVLVSADGKQWTPQRAPWSPRGGAASCVYKGMIYMTGGKYGGAAGQSTNFVYSNDVWTLGRQ